jgi:hypothetical protein
MKKISYLMIWIVIVLVALSGCSLFKNERSELKKALSEFNKAQTDANDTVIVAEKDAAPDFEASLKEATDKMKKANNDFLATSGKIKDKKLKKSAGVCEKGMTKIMTAYEDYRAAREQYLMFRNSVVAQFAEQAKKAKERAYNKFKKEVKSGEKMIDKSGI